MYPNATNEGAGPRPLTMSDHMQSIRDDVLEAAERLRNIADRVSGNTPRAVADAKTSPAFSLHSSASEIKSGLSLLRDEINRLDNSI